MGNTLQLIIAAEVLAILLAIAIRVYSAVRQYSAFDRRHDLQLPRARDAGVLAGADAPGARRQHLHRIGAPHLLCRAAELARPGHGYHFLLDRMQHLALPVFVLAVANIAAYSRFMRASMLEVINSDYVRTARAKG